MNLKLIVLVPIFQLIVVTRIEGQNNLCNEKSCCNVNLYYEKRNFVLSQIPNNQGSTFELRCVFKEKMDALFKCEDSINTRHCAYTPLELAVCISVIAAFIVNVICFYRNRRRTKLILKLLKQIETLKEMSKGQALKEEKTVEENNSSEDMAMVSNEHQKMNENIDLEEIKSM